jgi:hypothetical protein
MKSHYSTNLLINIREIVADSPEEAEAVIQAFIDLIAPIMEDKIRWDEVDWIITETVDGDEATESPQIVVG